MSPRPQSPRLWAMALCLSWKLVSIARKSKTLQKSTYDCYGTDMDA